MGAAAAKDSEDPAEPLGNWLVTPNHQRPAEPLAGRTN